MNITQDGENLKKELEGSKKIDKMIVDLKRYNSQADYTDGMFFVNGEFICYSVEDEFRTKKVYAETRIPNGTYKIGLRTAGKFHESYLKKFGADFHKGMLCVYNKPDWKLENMGMSFQYILIHIGNDDDDTAGCLLPGMVAYADRNYIEQSTVAYKKLYPIIRDALLKGEEVEIRVDIL